MNKNLQKIISGKSKVSQIELLALVISSAVLRKENIYRDLLTLAKKKKINGRKIYEAVLQTYLFAGFPSALISLSILREYFSLAENNLENISLSETKTRGEITCKKIYGEKFDKLISNTKQFSPELSQWLVIEGYGKVLSRNFLSLKERELMIISILTVLKYEAQLYSHINGAYRMKAKLNEIRAAINCAGIVGGESIRNFGNKVLEKFIEQKGVKI